MAQEQQQSEEKEIMHIKVARPVYVWLESKKIHPRQSFNEVLENIMNDEVTK